MPPTTQPIYPHFLKKSHIIEAKFEICCRIYNRTLCSWCPTDIKASADFLQNLLLAWWLLSWLVGWFTGQFASVHFSGGVSSDYRSVSNRKTHPASEITVCSQIRILWGITRVCLINGELKFWWSCGRGQGAAAGVWVKQLLFISDTVSGVCLAAVP